MNRDSHASAVLRLLEAQIDALETGLAALDVQLQLSDDAFVDVLARDSLGYPVVALLCDDDPLAALGRMASVVSALARGRHLLTRLYAGRGLDPALRPRFVLLSRRFPDDFPLVLDLLTYEVRAVEYRLVQQDGGKPRLDLVPFHRSGGTPPRGRALAGAAPDEGARAPRAVPSPGERPADPASRVPVPEPRHENGRSAPATGAGGGREPRSFGREPRPSGARVEAPPAGETGPAPRRPVAGATAGGSLRPGPARAETATAEAWAEVEASAGAKALFVRARDSIRSLSGHLRETEERGRMSFLVHDRHLATLGLDTSGLHLRVGDAPAPGVLVRDDTEFNAGLNAVFTHYFNELSLRA